MLSPLNKEDSLSLLSSENVNENKTVYSAFVLLLSSNERETALWSVVVFAGAEQTPAYSLHAGAATLLLVPSHLSQCRAVPDTGRLSDRRPL